MRPPESAPSPSDGEARRLPGRRFVIGLLVGPVIVAAVVILVGVVVIANRGEDGACDEEPAVCDAVRQYVAAFNERDAVELAGVLTERGLRDLLAVASQAELEQRLERLTPVDRIEDIEIRRLTLEGDQAQVSAIYTQRDEEFNALYRLVRDDSTWRIDG